MFFECATALSLNALVNRVPILQLASLHIIGRPFQTIISLTQLQHGINHHIPSVRKGFIEYKCVQEKCVTQNHLLLLSLQQYLP